MGIFKRKSDNERYDLIRDYPYDKITGLRPGLKLRVGLKLKIGETESERQLRQNKARQERPKYV